VSDVVVEGFQSSRGPQEADEVLAEQLALGSEAEGCVVCGFGLKVEKLLVWVFLMEVVAIADLEALDFLDRRPFGDYC